jgi:AAA15 family ATPase/GTPase
MADTSKHLTYFKVENFKRFESFEMKDLGQFNLIVGDNNVGKTSVLEALLVDEREVVFLNNLAKSLELRNIKRAVFLIRDLNNFANKKATLSNNYVINYEWLNFEEKENSKLSISAISSKISPLASASYLNSPVSSSFNLILNPFYY